SCFGFSPRGSGKGRQDSQPLFRLMSTRDHSAAKPRLRSQMGSLLAQENHAMNHGLKLFIGSLLGFLLWLSLGAGGGYGTYMFWADSLTKQLSEYKRKA